MNGADSYIYDDDSDVSLVYIIHIALDTDTFNSYKTG